MARLDRAKLSAWFAAHGPALVLYARQVLPSDDQWAAEDVVQEVFTHLLARAGGSDVSGVPDAPDTPGGLAEPPNPAAWLHRCVHYACLDTRRAGTRRRHRERAAATSRPAWFDPSPGDLVDAQAAQAALAALPELSRQVVVLRVWSGLTLGEVAEVTGQPVSTVHDQYRRALAALRQRIEAGSRTEARS
jgi:RNA polymerase sigma-70 factor (ECF subfamily)